MVSCVASSGLCTSRLLGIRALGWCGLRPPGPRRSTNPAFLQGCQVTFRVRMQDCSCVPGWAMPFGPGLPMNGAAKGASPPFGWASLSRVLPGGTDCPLPQGLGWAVPVRRRRERKSERRRERMDARPQPAARRQGFPLRGAFGGLDPGRRLRPWGCMKNEECRMEEGRVAGRSTQPSRPGGTLLQARWPYVFGLAFTGCYWRSSETPLRGRACR